MVISLKTQAQNAKPKFMSTNKFSKKLSFLRNQGNYV